MRVYTPQRIDVFKDEYHLNEQSENDAHILPQFQKFLQSEESVLKKAYVPYELYSLKLTISNILNDKNAKLMSESLDEERYTYPPEFTVSAIKDVYYTLTDEQIRLMKRMNDIVVILLVGNIGNNIELIVRDMDKCGYFVANRKDIRDSSDRLWSQIAFEPYVTQNIFDKVKEMGTFIHLTPEKNVEDIKKNGITAHAKKSTLYNYPERAYFFTNDMYPNHLRQVARSFASAKDGILNWIVCIIDSDLISDDMRFYYDPNQEEGFFTYQEIAPEWIIRYVPLEKYSPIVRV